MDELIQKFLKKVPLGIIIGCIAIQYKVIDSIFYPNFSADINKVLKSVFKTFTFLRIAEGTVVSRKSSIFIDKGKYDIKDISRFLGYPCSVEESECNQVKLILKYDNTSDELLTMYCDKMDKTLEKFIRRIVTFINKLDGKLKKNLTITTKTQKYYTIDKIRRLVDDNKKLDKHHKTHIMTLLNKYGYQKVVKLGAKIYLKKHLDTLSLLLRLCDLEQRGFFNPSDTKLKASISSKFK